MKWETTIVLSNGQWRVKMWKGAKWEYNKPRLMHTPSFCFLSLISAVTKHNSNVPNLPSNSMYAQYQNQLSATFLVDKICFLCIFFFYSFYLLFYSSSLSKPFIYCVSLPIWLVFFLWKRNRLQKYVLVINKPTICMLLLLIITELQLQLTESNQLWQQTTPMILLAAQNVKIFFQYILVTIL